MKHHKFIFISGLHRSGTSLLSQSLRTHPKVSGFQNTGVPEEEGQFLQSVYLPGSSHGGPGRFGFDPQAYLDETSPLVSPSNAERLFNQWGKFWDLSKPFLLEKSPPNLLRNLFLQALYPDSYFIALIRHPVAVSYATQKWSHTTLDSLIRHWLRCHEHFWDDRPHLKNLLVLKYERFVAEPQKTLDRIYTFLGIDAVPATRVVRSDENDRYFLQWEKMRRSPFTGFYARYMALRYEQQVNRFGYSLVRPLSWTDEN